MVSFRHSGSRVASMESLVAKYPSREFDSPMRSTVPSLAFWMDTQGRVSELRSALGVTPPGDCTIEFEYQVAPPAGKGRESHTDVMLWCGTTCIGVEAKYTEPPYGVVSRWLKEGPEPENRAKVLGGWCDLIAKTTGKQCDSAALGEVTYQMIHRIASVCSRPEKQKHVVYQIFDPQQEKVAHYRQELARLKRLFATGSAVGLHIAKVAVHASDVHKALVTAWKKDRMSRSADVTAGLVAGTLMSFGPISVETV